MLGLGAKCVTAKTAAAVPPPGAGWAGKALQKYIYQEPKSGAMSQHSQSGNGYDSYFLEVFLR